MGSQAREWTAKEMAIQIREKQISSVELCRALLEEIQRADQRVKAFITLFAEEALDRAREMDSLLSKGKAPSPWTGVPIAIKDNLCMEGTSTTCASKILEGFVSPYDAKVVSLLKEAGLVILGKTNLDEFAMGSSTENSAFGPTRNPWDLKRAPGGSSGGSAAAVAAGLVPWSLGSDTGGSIRQPASFCGVVGLKPTYGTVSRYGLVAFASSLDQIGPFSRTVEDGAALFDLIAAPDAMDSTCSSRHRTPSSPTLSEGVEGLVLGMPKEYFEGGLDPEVKESVMRGCEALESAGARLQEVSLPRTEYAIATYYLVATAEASSNLARYDGVQYGMRKGTEEGLRSLYENTRREGFGEEVKRRIMLGTYALSSGYYDAYYLKALKVRALLREDFQRAFESCDLLITPTTPTTPFLLGERTDDPISMYLSDVLTVSANLAGIPGVSLPCGKSAQGLPIGFQILGKPFEENLLFRAAWALETSLGTLGVAPLDEGDIA